MIRTRIAALALVACLARAALAESDASGTRLPTWTAPPFWSPPASAVAREAEGLTPPPPPPTPLPFVAVPPCRVVDTRGNGAPLTGGFLPAATERDYAVTGLCGIPPTARAVSFNATVVHPAGPGFLVLFPAGGGVPPVSTLNYVGGDVVANAAVVELGATPFGPSVAVALGVSGGDVILDVNGYYAPAPSVTSLNALTGDVTLAAGSNVSLTPAGNTITIAAAQPSALPPTGPAGGALAGAYPNPSLATGAVSAGNIASGQVVKTLNGVTDAVTIAAGNNVVVSTVGGTVTVATPVPPYGRALQTVAQSFPTGVPTRVNLDTLTQSSQTTLSGNQINITKAGMYQITGELLWVANGAGFRLLTLNTVFTGEIAADTRPAVNGYDTLVTISTIVRLSAGDGVYLAGAHTTGAALGTSPFNGRAAALNVAWVAP